MGQNLHANMDASHKYTEKASVVASWLVDLNQYVREYYSKC